MRPTHEDVRDWAGRDALDAEGVRLGVVAPAPQGDDGVVPAWLAVELDEAAAEIVLVPADGAEVTGTAIRAAVLERSVRSAPPAPAGRPLTAADDTALAAHYAAARPGSGGHPEPAPGAPEPPARLDGAVKREIVARLREAHALEGEGLARLELLRSSVADPELRDGATLHAGQTALHRAGVEARLEALGASPSRGRDAAKSARAAVGGLRTRLGSDAAAARDAEAFERREAAFYAELEAFARAAGDSATADLAAALGADEAAQADMMAGCVPRLDSPA